MGNVSAKILRKKVDDGQYGTKRYSFYIAYQGQEKWVSAFADPKKMAPEVIETLRGLGEGDRAEFTLVENPSKDGTKTYLNIAGVVREQDVRDDMVEPVQPDGKRDTPRAKVGDAPDSMIMSYAKDGAGYLTNSGDTPEEFVRKVFIIYGGLKAILAGAYKPEGSEDTPF